MTGLIDVVFFDISYHNVKRLLEEYDFSSYNLEKSSYSDSQDTYYDLSDTSLVSLLNIEDVGSIIINDGAVRISSTSTIEEFGTAGPNGGFVLPKSELDNIIKEANGNINVIEQKLGLSQGQLSSGEFSILEIAPEDFNNIRVPSGNEKGVNDNWRAGGYTSGGVPEAVMDLSNGVPFKDITSQIVR